MNATELVTTIAAVVAIVSAISGHVERRRELRKQAKREPIEIQQLVLDGARAAVDLQGDLFDDLIETLHRLKAENAELRERVTAQNSEIERLTLIIGQMRANREGSTT